MMAEVMTGGWSYASDASPTKNLSSVTARGKYWPMWWQSRWQTSGGGRGILGGLRVATGGGGIFGGPYSAGPPSQTRPCIVMTLRMILWVVVVMYGVVRTGYGLDAWSSVRCFF